AGRGMGQPSEIDRPWEEDWISEGLAHQYERGADNLDYRVDAYLRRPESSPLVVPDYFRAERFRDHACRGAAYLFLHWTAGVFGEECLRHMALSPSGGTATLEAATGIPFEELFRAWTLELAAPHAGERRLLAIDGRFGRYVLSGPRRHVWTPEAGPAQL